LRSAKIVGLRIYPGIRTTRGAALSIDDLVRSTSPGLRNAIFVVVQPTDAPEVRLDGIWCCGTLLAFRSPSNPVSGQSINFDSSVTTSAFVGTYLVRLSTSGLLARNDFLLVRNPVKTP
jgi:hypothetical protein